MTYALSVLFAALHTVLVVCSALFLFVVSRWSENVTPEEAAENDWLGALAPVLLVLAVGVLVAVIVRRWCWAAAGLVVEGAVVAIVLVYALGESTHSDHQLILYTTGVMALGYAAVALSARPG